ncbi:hypothetical protein [Methylobacterium sp. Leaf113]|uniref:hypothetical protein n=1 Tax=Methylobacterium sp. Leaf113 TaxID=1736259 RepID=UPI0012E7ED95|nr:hypothetical protein [Methylobacterium sp. Leaf113]
MHAGIAARVRHPSHAERASIMRSSGIERRFGAGPIATISTRLSNGAGIPNAVIFPSVTLSPEMIEQNIERQTRHLVRRSIVDDL